MSWLKRGQSDPGDGPRIEELSASETAWVEGNLTVLANAEVQPGDVAALGALYDAQLTSWLAAPTEERSDPNPLINLIGLGLGEYLRRECGMRWVLATDGHGFEIAIHREPGNVILYPTNIVAKRWVAQERGIIPELAEAMVQSVHRLPGANQAES
jgi:hypothetical protein